MNLKETIILGLVQGVTEFLPISSSAHLIILRYFFKIEGGDITYDVMLHFATLIATFTLYGRRFLEALSEGIKSLRGGGFTRSMVFFIGISSFPAFLAGYLFRETIEEKLRTTTVCSFMLILVSILMLIAEAKRKNGRELNWMIALTVGVGQMLSLIPGTSRSGITITTALLFGLRRHLAVDFSFLMSFPVIFGAFFYELRHVNPDTCLSSSYILGMIFSTVSGILSLRFLVSYLRGHTLKMFAWYRILLAFLVLLSSSN